MDQIVGHTKEKLFLERVLKPGALGRTFHFTGPSRLGKRFTALMYALKLRGEGEREFNLALRGDHPDITIFSPEGKVALHPAEAARELIAISRQPPYQGDFRIVILDGADRMQGISSNTLLKTLEEPLKTTFIFLISERKERILPTILSRSVEVTFSPISHALILEKLKGDGKITRELAVHLSKGSLSRAKAYFAEGLPLWRDILFSLLASSDAKTYFVFRDEIKKMVEPIAALKEETSLHYFEVVYELLETVAEWYRDLHALKEGGGKALLNAPDQLQLLEARLERGNIPPLSAVLKAIEEAHLAIDRSNSLQTTLESLLLETRI